MKRFVQQLARNATLKAKTVTFVQLTIILMAMLMGPLAALAQTDVRSVIGGNVSGSLNDTTALALAQSGAKVARLGSDRAAKFWDGSAATPQNFDSQVKAAYQNKLRPFMNLIQYTKYEPNTPIGGYDKWHKIGRAFAERFQPNSAWLKSQGINNWGVEYYGIHNELWNGGFYSPKLTPQQVYDSSKGFADGIHSINSKLKVTVVGWVGESEMLPPLVPLYNNGTLASFGYHKYWWGWEPVNGTYQHSAQRFVDNMRNKYGLNDNVRFNITEWNVNRIEGNTSDVGSRFLTAIWDRTGTVNSANQPNCDFTLIYTVAATPSTAHDGDKFSLASSLSPWTPLDDRGRILQNVTDITDGMRWVWLDPKGKGEFLLNGNNKKLWVWQNRNGWTNHPGTSYTVNGIPAAATQLKVYSWNGLRQTINLNGQSSYTLTNLAEGQTYMFLVNAADGGTGPTAPPTNVTETPGDG